MIKCNKLFVSVVVSPNYHICLQRCIYVHILIEERNIIMLIANIFLTIFWLLILPLLIGTLIVNQLLKERTTDLVLAWLSGFIIMFASFYILVMPMLFMKLPLHVLVISWCILMLFLFAVSIIYNRNRFDAILLHNINRIKLLPWLTILVVLLICVQVYFLAVYMHSDADDAFYVATATTSVSTDTIFQIDSFTGKPFLDYPQRYVLSPFPVFIALLSQILITHPAIVAHTILPIVFIPLSYGVFSIIGKKLFHDRSEDVVFFLLFLCILNIYGNFSAFTNSTFLLFRIWQGKAVLANIILPSIFYFSYRAMLGEKHKGEWITLFFCVLASCLTSSMGIVLTPIMIGCMGIVFAIRNKKIRTLLFSIACCLPCIVCGFIYL